MANGFVYDVEVNWADGMHKSYLIPEYHEWYQDDEVEKITCLPVVLVTKALYNFVEQEYDVIPRKLLNQVYGKAAQKIDGMQCPINYAFVVTDGERALAVDTDDEEVPNYKSYLSPKNYQKVMELIPKLGPVQEFEFTPPTPRELGKDEQLAAELLLLDEKYVVGLTRAEKDMKSILMTYIYTLLTSTNNEEVRYWYSSVFPGTFNDAKVKKMRKTTLVKKMFDELKDGWDDRHIRLGEDFVRVNDLFKESWVVSKKRQKERVSA